MNIVLKNTVALSLLSFSYLSVTAQENVSKYYTVPKKEATGEIVMTQQELDNFLEKIAQHKRQQMEKRRNELILNRKTNQLFNAQGDTKPQVINESISLSENQLLLRELDRINNRIDLLMLNNGGGGRTVIQPSYVPNTQPVIYTAPNTPAVAPINSVVPLNSVANDENALLRKQIDVLKEELRVLNALSQNGSDEKYQGEIAALNKKIQELDANMHNRIDSVHTTNVITVREHDELRKGLESYNQKVFFENNSTVVKPSDKEALKQVVDIVRKNSPRVTVVLRGYASKKGTAIYNNTISFNRAEAVKKILLDYGLSSKDIMTLHHGVDEGHDEASSRRVEVTLLVQ